MDEEIQQSMANYCNLFAGIMGSFFNIIVLRSLLPTKDKHKLLVVGLSAGDLINSLGYLSFGIRALVLKATHTKHDYPYYTHIQCLLIGVHINFFEIGESVSSFMTFFLSVDRFIAMLFTMFYHNLDQRYPNAAFLFTMVYAGLDFLVSVIGTVLMEQSKLISKRCGHPQTVPQWYYAGHTLIIIGLGCLSVTFYCGALLAIKLKIPGVYRNSSSFEKIQEQQRKREIQITKHVAAVIMVTFIFEVVPLTIYFMGLSDSYVIDVVGPYLWNLYSFTACTNVVLYCGQRPEFRQKLKEIFSCMHCNCKVAPQEALTIA